MLKTLSRTRTRRHPRIRPSPRRETAVERPVLVAVDGSQSASGAIRFASAMEDAGAWAPRALTVVEHVPVPVNEVVFPALAAPPVPVSPDLTNTSIAAVRRQVRRNGGKAWPFRSEVGRPAPWIVDVARDATVDLIVLGLGKHGKLARIFGAETAARVCRHSDVPVLAVDHHAPAPPTTVVAAVDFGPSSVRAAREAAALLVNGGSLHLLHVRFAIDGQTLREPAWERTYGMGVRQAFESLTRQLRRPELTITHEFRHGGILESILDVARERGADVVAMGSHSQTVMDRLLLGSTPAHVLRAATCSVLIAPPLPDAV